MASSRRGGQLALPLPRTWGGARRGAGRKPVEARPGPTHRTRPRHVARHPVHVTLRARRDVPSLRASPVFGRLRRALGAASRSFFRVLHFSVQSDHVHLVVEADSTLALTRGVQGLAVRCARAINRACGRRGGVWKHRYHAHFLTTPREVRTTLVYVLLNFRKHLHAGPTVDPCSSGPWFDGWRHSPPSTQPPSPSPTPTPTSIPAPAPAASPVCAPRTWLASWGWRRAGGLIDCREAPARPAARPVGAQLQEHRSVPCTEAAS
jgi:REP element-mobilizing transposase RayT